MRIKHVVTLSFIIIAVVIVVGYRIFILSGYIRQFHEFLLTGVFMLFLFYILFISFQIKIKHITFGTISLLTVAIIDIISLLLFSPEERNHFSFIIDSSYIACLSIWIRGMYKNMLHLKKQEALIYNQYKRIFMFTNMSEMVYFERNLETEVITLEFSDSFIKKYQLNYQKLNITSNEFINFIHPDDIN